LRLRWFWLRLFTHYVYVGYAVGCRLRGCTHLLVAACPARCCPHLHARTVYAGYLWLLRAVGCVTRCGWLVILRTLYGWFGWFTVTRLRCGYGCRCLAGSWLRLRYTFVVPRCWFGSSLSVVTHTPGLPRCCGCRCPLRLDTGYGYAVVAICTLHARLVVALRFNVAPFTHVRVAHVCLCVAFTRCYAVCGYVVWFTLQLPRLVYTRRLRLVALRTRLRVGWLYFAVWLRLDSYGLVCWILRAALWLRALIYGCLWVGYVAFVRGYVCSPGWLRFLRLFYLRLLRFTRGYVVYIAEVAFTRGRLALRLRLRCGLAFTRCSRLYGCWFTFAYSYVAVYGCVAVILRCPLHLHGLLPLRVARLGYSWLRVVGLVTRFTLVGYAHAVGCTLGLFGLILIYDVGLPRLHCL